MTNQEIFDKVVTHLLTQGRKALRDDGECAYRGEGGTSCAVGCLIKDEFYSPEIEGNRVGSTEVGFALDPSLGIRDIYEQKGLFTMLESLQRIHDEQPVAAWPSLFQGLAVKRGLTMPEVSK